MTEFKKFSSLENTYNKGFLERVFMQPCYTQEWIATEKIHGANFSFWWDKENGVRVASRTQFVDGSFFSCTDVINRHSVDFEDYCKDFLPDSTVVVYGELFGGNIQKEVKYGEKRFAAFDIVIDGSPLSKLEAFKLASVMGFATTPILGQGGLEDLLNISPEFVSPLAAEDAGEHNKSEGLVIEPITPAWLLSGSRIYLKQKSQAFKEKKDKPVHKPQVDLSEKGAEMLSLLSQRCTEQRVSNVLSKLGEVNTKQFGKLLGLFIQDVLEEVKREDGIDVKEECGDEWKAVNTAFTKEAQLVVRGVFVTHLN